MRLRLSAAARADLREIGLYIARDNPTRAEGFVLEFAASLPNGGNASAAIPSRRTASSFRIPAPPLQELSHLLPNGEQVVEVVRILHGARDYEKILFPESD